MTDDDHIVRRLAAAPPPPADDALRARHLDAAMAAFDTAQEKNSEARQGSAESARPTVRQSGLTALWRRMMTLTLPSTRSMMLGGTSLAVLTMALVIGHGTMQDQMGPGTGQLTIGTSVEEHEVASGGLVTEADGRTPADAPADAAATTEDEFLEALGRVAAQEQARGAAGGQPRGLQGPDKVAPSPKIQASPVVDGVQPLAPPMPEPEIVQSADREQGRDQFEEIETNPVKVVTEEGTSTFSIDVDTASYSFLRRQLMQGVLPQKDAVRIEEMINYFPYDYAAPDGPETPFATHVSVMDSPWAEGRQLMRIGIKGYELVPEERPRANLVFLLDTSGSMGAPDKLPLLINSFRMMVDNLDPADTVSIVVYAGSAGTVLEPTAVAEKGRIFAALERLQAGGSTAGGEGIRQAYALAERSFDPEGINRVILATDGDFNVGITSTEELKGFVERKRETGVYLSVLGFGQGNLNDQLMQALAQNGNGVAAHIDTLSEARKVLVEEATSALFPIAQDVKIQVEFNPAAIAEYRLIGYETRMLAREDFRNDRVDAGEIGSGHTVTAIYEITPVGGELQVEPPRYGQQAEPYAPADELAFLRIRYKEPGARDSQLIERPITEADRQAPDADARFAAAVAGFGELLRGGKYTGEWGYDALISLAIGAKGPDPYGYRAEFVNLVRLAQNAAALPR